MTLVQQSPTCKISNIDYKQLCKNYQDTIPINMLQYTFGVKITTYKDQHKYSKLFNKNCEENLKNFFKFDQIQEAAKNIKDDKEFIKTYSNYLNLYYYAEKYYKNPDNPYLEIFINTIIFLTENLAPWSIFFCATPAGIRIIKQVFQNDKIAVITLSVWLTQIWLLNQYDNLFFRKEFFSFLPTVVTLNGIKEYFKQAVIRASLIGLKKFLVSYYSMFDPSVKEEESVETVQIIENKQDSARKSIRKYEVRTSQRKKKRQSRRRNY